MPRRNNLPADVAVDRTGAYDDDITDALAENYFDLAAAVYRQAYADLEHPDPYIRKTARILLGREKQNYA